MSYINERQFNDPQNWMRAEGVNLSEDEAFVSTNGEALFYARTGGMMSPRRHVLEPGDSIYRMAGSTHETLRILEGSWWLEKDQFRKIVSFAQQNDLTLGFAMRMLCLVPPGWSDMGRLMHARVRRPLLAMRGLGESVVADEGDGLPPARIEARNDNPARRVYQLFIPGLREPGLARNCLQISNVHELDPNDSMRGWIYV